MARRLPLFFALCALLAPIAAARADEGGSQLLAGNQVQGKPVSGYVGWLAANGINGRGVRISVVDTGVDADHPDLQGRVVEEINYDPPQLLGSDVDEQGHGTHVAGIVAGNPDLESEFAFTDADGLLYGMGVAPGADIVAQNGLGLNVLIESSRLREMVPMLARDAVRAGAVAWNASWHTGEGAGAGYVETARVVDGLVRDADSETPGLQPLIMVFSAGNAGPGESTLTAPHEAKNLIAVAASKGQRASGETSEIASFSSRGPATDGRIVPTVAAPGDTISSARSKPLGGLCFEPADVSPIHSNCSGTSMAAPHTAGAVALLTQWWQGFNGGRKPSPAMAKALLVNTATDLGDRDVPNADEGWGRVNVGTLLAPGSSRIYADQQQTLDAAGQAHTIKVEPIDPALPMRATLAWTDAPGKAVAADAKEEELAKPVLVNDLDLTVSTGNATYFGNAFKEGRSIPGGQPNRLDNVENVWLERGQAATVTVSASALPGDGVPGAGDATDQDYALVLSNARVMTAPGPVAGAPVPAAVAPRPVATARWGRRGARTVLRALTVSPVPAGTKVQLTCSGRGCPRGTFRKTFATGVARADLTRRLSGKRLGRGARVRLRVIAPGVQVRTSTWTMGRKAGKPALRVG